MHSHPFSLTPNVDLGTKNDFPVGLKEHTDDNVSFICFSAFIIAVMMFLAYYLGRIGMGESFNILPLLLATTILLLPGLFLHKSRNLGVLLQVGVIIFFFVLGWISILTQTDLSLIVYAIFFPTIYFFFKRRKFSTTKLKLLLVLLFGFELIALVWTPDYMNPLAPEAYSVGLRFIHVDTLFLSAMTSNIKHHQVASTGLFGLVPFPYHSGSNVLFASYAQLCKISVLQFYNLAYPVIFVPLFFQSLLIASFSGAKTKASDVRIIVSFVVLFFILAGLYPSGIAKKFLLPTGMQTHFISQSYCLSLIFSFLAICLFSPLLRKQSLHTNPVINALLFLSIPVWILVIGYTKLSTAVVLLAVLSYLFLRRGLFSRWWVLAGWLLGTLTLYYILTVTVQSNENTFLIQWGSYYSMYIDGNILCYVFLHYTFFILLVAAVSFLTAKTSHRYHSEQVRTGRFLIIELILVAAVVGAIPGLMIHIEGGSAYYFSDIQYWLTAIPLISVASYLAMKYRAALKQHYKVVYIVGFVLLVIMVRESFFRSFYYYMKKNLQIRTALVYGKEEKLKELRNHMPTGKLLRSITIDITEAPLFHDQVDKLNLPLFDSLRRLPPAVLEAAAVYCEDPEYLETFLTCAEATFYVPAMSELPMINGLHWADECYQIGAYGMRSYPAFAGVVSKDDAYDLARSKGFKYLLSLNLKEHSYVLDEL